MKHTKIELFSVLILILAILYYGYTLIQIDFKPRWITWSIILILLIAVFVAYKLRVFKEVVKKGESYEFLINLGIFKMYKRDLFVVIGAIFGLIGLFKLPLIFGTLTLVCGIISKFKKSIYWSWLIFGGFGVIVLYLINTFWI